MVNTTADNDKKRGNLPILRIKKQLNNPHPEIVKHRAVIRRAKSEIYYGHPVIDIRGIHIQRQAILDTHSVSERTLQKAYIFLDTLLKAVERSGGAVEVTKERSCFIVDGEKVFFRLKEQYLKVPAHFAEPKDAFESRSNLKPSGLLKIIIGYENVRGNHYSDPSCEFKESERKTLDKIITDVYNYIFEQPQRIKEDRAEYQEYLIKQHQELNEETRTAELHDAELEKTKELISRAKQYELSRIICEYANHLRASGCPDEYIKWAKKKAEWLDPASPFEDPVLNDIDKTLFWRPHSSNSV